MDFNLIFLLCLCVFVLQLSSLEAARVRRVYDPNTSYHSKGLNTVQYTQGSYDHDPARLISDFSDLKNTQSAAKSLVEVSTSFDRNSESVIKFETLKTLDVPRRGRRSRWSLHLEDKTKHFVPLDHTLYSYDGHENFPSAPGLKFTERFTGLEVTCQEGYQLIVETDNEELIASFISLRKMRGIQVVFNFSLRTAIAPLIHLVNEVKVHCREDTNLNSWTITDANTLNILEDALSANKESSNINERYNNPTPTRHRSHKRPVSLRDYLSEDTKQDGESLFDITNYIDLQNQRRKLSDELPSGE